MSIPGTRDFHHGLLARRRRARVEPQPAQLREPPQRERVRDRVAEQPQPDQSRHIAERRHVRDGVAREVEPMQPAEPRQRPEVRDPVLRGRKGDFPERFRRIAG